jgi:hypothetical protein
MAEAGLEGFRTEWAPSVADLLVDPAVSFALRDARLLAEVLERRADEAVSWTV